MIYELTIPQFQKTLRNLKAILTKAQAFSDLKKINSEVLLQSRLAPDQFNLLKQVQIICDTSKLCASRLTGKEAPFHDDAEKSIPELLVRIDSVIGYLNTFNSADFEKAESMKVTQPRWEGKWLAGKDFVIHHAIPNFYFHVTTAYSILRHNGVDLGKKDYLGEIPFQKPL